MASAAARVVGERIADARARGGLTQAALATAIQVDRSIIGKIEIGARRVSALELARIADALGERIEWFLEDGPPALVSRRNLLEPGAPSPAIDKLVDRIARNVEFVVEHDPHLRLQSPPTMNRPRSESAVEVMATEARAMLSTSVDEPMLNLGERMASVGLLAFSLDLGPDAADGASILLGSGGIGLVNGHRQVGRRRLTMAHEFGHYVVGDEYIVDWQVDNAAGTDRWEARLDRFARALLLPSSGLRRAWEHCQTNEDDLRTAAVKVASQFRVDMSTLARRLNDLHLISAAQAHSVRGVRTTRADIVELDLLVHHELDPPYLPRPYVSSVLRLFRNETISAARAVDLLFDTWEEAELPELPELPETAIWKFV